MVVAGLDCSTTKSGVTILLDGELQFYTLVDLHKEKDVIKRMNTMMLELCEILDQYELDEIHIEKAIMKGGNVDTTQKLSYISGAIMLYCAQRNIKFVNPLPSQWRSKIGIQQSSKIKREVLKAEAIKAVKDLYGIDVNDDVAESCLLARSAFDLPKLNITEDDLWEVN